MKIIEEIKFLRHFDADNNETRWYETWSHDDNTYNHSFRLATIMERLEQMIEVSTMDEELEVILIRRK